jgi:hypothetical protein
MSHFVGLDASQKMTAICVVDGWRIWQAQCRCDRRSLAHPLIPSQRDLSGLGPQAVSVRVRRQMILDIFPASGNEALDDL